MSARPWSEVRKHALIQRDEYVKALVTAPPVDVLALQVRIQTIDQFIAWFEAGASADQMIGDNQPIAGY